MAVFPRHAWDNTPHGCPRCPANLCKGAELALIREEHPGAPVVYCGDGANDFCPALRLTEADAVLARKGFALDRLIQVHCFNPLLERTNINSNSTAHAHARAPNGNSTSTEANAPKGHSEGTASAANGAGAGAAAGAAAAVVPIAAEVRHWRDHEDLRCQVMEVLEALEAAAAESNRTRRKLPFSDVGGAGEASASEGGLSGSSAAAVRRRGNVPTAAVTMTAAAGLG